MNYQLETVLVLTAVAAASAVPGVFLLLRRMALVSDAISHVLLLEFFTSSGAGTLVRAG